MFAASEISMIPKCPASSVPKTAKKSTNSSGKPRNVFEKVLNLKQPEGTHVSSSYSTTKNPPRSYKNIGFVASLIIMGMARPTTILWVSSSHD